MNFEYFFGDAKYVCASDEYYFPYIRKRFFTENKIKEAKLYISALGFCEIYINGRKITDDLYITPLSEYNRQYPEDMNNGMERDPFFTDDLSYTIYVSEFDVLNFLKKGNNAIGIILAGGWYRSGMDKHKGFRNFGKTKVCFRLEIKYIDGSTVNVISDKECKWERSFLTESGIFHEEQDERKEQKDFSLPDFDDEKWEKVSIEKTPQSKFIRCDCPSDKIIKWVKPVLLKDDGKEKVYDVGENITGFVVISGKSNAGDRIQCVYSERIENDNSLNEFHSYSQYSDFISDGRKEHYIRFTWHGFRYFSVKTTGNLKNIKVKKCAITYADVKNISNFNCDNETVNFIYKSYIRSQLENFHCGVPTDCPQIERKGYTGDGQLLSELGMTLFDSRKLYQKWMQDISDVQDRKTGFVHNTAPCFVGCSGGPGGWSVAIINVPYNYYKIYADKSVLDKYYAQMQLYLNYMDEESVEGLVSIHKKPRPCLGDWSGPEKPFLPEDFVNSCLYADALYKMIEIAKTIGRNDDAEKYLKRVEQLKEDINKKYYDADTGDFCENKQASNAFALNIGLGDKRTLKNLVSRYSELKGFDTGIFGTKILPKVLFENGYPEIALALYTSKNPVSFYSWMKDGATTLYESWQNTRSLNHPMFGSVVLYIFEYILGIRQVSGAGYKDVIIEPCLTHLLQRARGSIQTVAGKFSVSYKYVKGLLKFEIEIPEKVNCEFRINGTRKKLKAGKNKFYIKNEQKQNIAGECEKERFYEKAF